MEPWPVSCLAPPAALASLRDKGYRKRTAQFLSTEKAYVLKKLERTDRAKAVATPWGVLIRVEPPVADLHNLLADQGVLVHEYRDADGRQYLSFPFRSHTDNARLIRTLQWVLRQC